MGAVRGRVGVDRGVGKHVEDNRGITHVGTVMAGEGGEDGWGIDAAKAYVRAVLSNSRI